MKNWFTYVGPILFIVFTACAEIGDGTPGADADGDTPGVDAGEQAAPDTVAPLVDTEVAGPLFQSCTDGAPPSGLPTVRWSNWLNYFITTGDPWHSAQDIIAATDGEAVLAGKFTYGELSKDLEGERIEVWIDDCAGGYRKLGVRTTNTDGRMALTLDPAALPAPGEYGVYFRVMGDNTAARATLRVYPPGTQLIVFDIDATLTTSDTALVGQIVAEILAGLVLPPEARTGAVDITALRRDQHGYELVFLTGRPYLLDGITREWLADLGFSGGTVHVTDEVGTAWPSDSHVGDYKAAFLQDVLDKGFTFHAAYGNATTDIYAYEQAGIPKERTYILGSHGGESGTVALGEDYLAHIEAVLDEPPAEQPFHR
jgi:phosphatidate phosphatase PAH1